MLENFYKLTENVKFSLNRTIAHDLKITLRLKINVLKMC